MKLLFGSILFVGSWFVAMPADVVAQEGRTSINDLSWFAGCWEITIASKGMQINELWMKPAGGLMIGSGRTVSGGKAVDYEFLRIVEESDGVFYIAKPTANKDETRFKLVRGSSAEAVFENPAHDFPQRIIYKRDGDKLNARIEGTKDGKTRGIDFPYTRAKCE